MGGRQSRTPRQEEAPVDSALVFQHFSDALQEKILVPSIIIRNLKDLQTTFCPEYSIALGNLETILLNAGDAHTQAFDSVNAFCNFLIPIMEEIVADTLDPDFQGEIVQELCQDGQNRLTEAKTSFGRCLLMLNEAHGRTVYMLSIIRGDVTAAESEYMGIFRFFRSRNRLDQLQDGYEQAQRQIELAQAVVEQARQHIKTEQNGVDGIRVFLQALSTIIQLPLRYQQVEIAENIIAQAQAFQLLRQARRQHQQT